MNSERNGTRCKAQTKAGKPCRAAATKSGLCLFHANPKKASELGRIGGRSKHRAVADDADPLPPLDTVIAVRNTNSRLIEEACSGKRHPRLAACLAPLLQLQLRAIEITDLQQEVAKLRKRVDAIQTGGGVDTDAAVRRPDSAASPSPKPEEGSGGKADPEPEPET